MAQVGDAAISPVNPSPKLGAALPAYPSTWEPNRKKKAPEHFTAQGVALRGEAETESVISSHAGWFCVP
jgi:hypothetical protein